MASALPTYHCNICGHNWHPRKAGTPLVCPKCHSPRWNDPEGRLRPPMAEQRATAHARRLVEAERTLHVSLTPELRESLLGKFRFVTPFNERVNVGVTNAGPWREMPEDTPERLGIFDIFDFDDDTDTLWKVTEAEGEGLCLTGDDIHPGDWLHFRSGLQPSNGDIVLAFGVDVDGRGFATTKHWYSHGKSVYGNETIELRCSNPDCETIRVFPFNVEIEAVALSCLKVGLRSRGVNSKTEALRRVADAREKSAKARNKSKDKPE